MNVTAWEGRPRAYISHNVSRCKASYVASAACRQYELAFMFSLLSRLWLAEYCKYRLSSRSTSLAAQDFLVERKTADGDASGTSPSPDGASTSGLVDVNDTGFEWEFKPPVERLASKEREPSLEFSTPNTDDESAGTPKALSKAASGQQPDLGMVPLQEPGKGAPVAGPRSSCITTSPLVQTASIGASSMDVRSPGVDFPTIGVASTAATSGERPEQQEPLGGDIDRKGALLAVLVSL